ncbi:CAAX prenyl protease 1 homolog [Scaptodrosophila lebanonensis]|uniref:CAAX prenyl protease n=1 Tax=Drosophila lebanonensis TaxID=7225 RepID=A0A6J2U566_DROLE|nr:CAAX prenyl protease 1 homolog [Scaptodrosophila lebanonensis]
MTFYDGLSIDPKLILYALIFIVVADHLWEIILTKRQLIVCQNSIVVPEELRHVISPEIFHRARIYELHKAELFIWKHFIEAVISVAELVFGFYPFLWHLAALTLAKLTSKEMWISIVFVFYLTIYICVRYLPVLAYEKCILELRYGGQQHFQLCLCCLVAVLAVVLSQILLAPATLLIVYCVQKAGYWFFLWFWLIWALFTLILVFFLPYCCIPCLGVQTPLREGALYTEVKRVCDMARFPMSRVFIIRTKTVQYSNAYFYGSCCLKRIVIFDTLLLNKGMDPSYLRPHEIGRGLTNSQVAGVVAHELGHWKYGHFYKATIIMKLHFLFTMVLFGLLFHCPQLYQAVGFISGLCPIIVGFLIVLRFALTPYLVIANFLMLWNLRRFEFAADKYAHSLGYSMQLRAALVKIYADHMSFPVFDRCYARWHHTHPTILQRLRYQEKLDVRANFNENRANLNQPTNY